MNERDLMRGVTQIDSQGRINLGAVLQEGVKTLNCAYGIDSGLVYVKSVYKVDEKFGGDFKWPVVKVDSKQRIILPAWIRKWIDTDHLGIAFDGDYLVLVPVYDYPKETYGLNPELEEESDKAQTGLPEVF